ncbi:MAG: TrkH family potassium uptake protein [Clostridium sp.]|nr:TrkH family potassium uptake protein [Clostridium sp.]
MNYRMIGFVLGRILLVESGLMAAPLIVTLLYGESAVAAFLIPIGLLLVLGLALGLRVPKDTTIYAREGLAVVALSWVTMSLFGALPFCLSQAIPSYIDSFFETVSGFTTTGASILSEVESMEHGLLFWRSFTHWVGGMGVLVFVMAVLPMADGRGMHLMRAEVPGPSVGKLSSKLSDTAKTLYAMYLVLTALEVVFLIAGGMPLFDALVNAFGTAGTGGFSHLNRSIGQYGNPYYEIVIGIFLLLFGINFNLYYFLLMRRFREVFRSEELLTYLSIVALATVGIAFNIRSICASLPEAFRQSFFQVATIITTAGFSSADFDLWPSFSKTVLVMLMFFGACAGSTAGGIKIARIVILFKSAARDVQRMIHPHAVATVRFEGKTLDDKTIRGTHLYLSAYLMLFVLSVLLISLEGNDLVTSFTSVAACLNNIGPGLGKVGPTGNFGFYSVPAKLLLSFDMLAGRLDIFPMLVLCAPAVWLKKLRREAR